MPRCIPVGVARQHHVVPIGRKFGAPVVAIADPTDVVAMDNLRAIIGREFVAVVATDEQIEACLERIYGEGPNVGAKRTAASGGSNPPAPVVSTSASTQSATTVDKSATTVDRGVDAARRGPRQRERISQVRSGGFASARPAHAHSARLVGRPAADSARLLGRPRRQLRQPRSRPARPHRRTHKAAPAPGPAGAPGTPDRPADVLAAALEAMDTTLAKSPASGSPLGDPAKSGVDDLLETSALLSLGDDTVAVPSTIEPPGETVEDVVAAADLVDEVVGEFESSGEVVVAAEEVPEGLAGFPPLARVLVEGERVSLAAMESVLDEREKSGQAIARILTVRGLVTEADLMWGMAQEMGLEFVDLELQSIDFAAAYHLPEATARHHNVLVIGNRDGVPVVAASNPTDVFAMDDLRTIIGRNFITVVATRSQINTYIDRAYHQGGDASEVATVGGLRTSRTWRRRGPGQPPGGGGRRPHRPLREPPRPPGPQRAGLGHPRRAHRREPPHPVPDRRGAARHLDRPPGDRVGRDHPPQGHGRHEHRRAPPAPGRSASR